MSGGIVRPLPAVTERLPWLYGWGFLCWGLGTFIALAGVLPPALMWWLLGSALMLAESLPRVARRLAGGARGNVRTVDTRNGEGRSSLAAPRPTGSGTFPWPSTTR